MQGSHLIDIDHHTMGETCGLLPVGVDSAYVKTEGLKWNLDWSTSFDGRVSTSNHLLPDQPVVHVLTSRPILWCVEIKPDLGSPSPKATRRYDASKSPDYMMTKGIKELGVGVVRAAGEVGREFERLRGGVLSGRPGMKGTYRRESLVDLQEDDGEQTRELHAEDDVWQQLA